MTAAKELKEDPSSNAERAGLQQADSCQQGTLPQKRGRWDDDSDSDDKKKKKKDKSKKSSAKRAKRIPSFLL